MVAQEDEQNEMHDMLETIVEETEEVSLHEHRATVSEDMLVFLTQASYGPKIGTSLATMLIQDLGIVNGKLLTLAYSLPLKAIVQGFTDKTILAYQEDMMRLLLREICQREPPIHWFTQRRHTGYCLY